MGNSLLKSGYFPPWQGWAVPPLPAASVRSVRRPQRSPTSLAKQGRSQEGASYLGSPRILRCLLGFYKDLGLACLDLGLVCSGWIWLWLGFGWIWLDSGLVRFGFGLIWVWNSGLSLAFPRICLPLLASHGLS